MADFCWNDSYGRGVGTPVNACNHKQKIGALCYSWCPEGYHRYALDCHSNCRDGYSESLWWCERWTLQWGWLPKREAHDKHIISGDPTSMTCGGKENDAGLCYNWCRNGYDGVGPVCWSKPRPGWVICGMGQARTDLACAGVTASQVTSVATAAIFVGTLGASSSTQPVLAQSKVQKLIDKLWKFYEKWELVIILLQTFVFSTKWLVDFGNAMDDYAKNGDIKATDVFRIVSQLTAIFDPTGISSILAAYTYDTCDKPEQSSTKPEIFYPPVVRAYKPQISGAFAVSAKAMFLDLDRYWQRVFDLGQGAAKHNVFLSQRENTNDMFFEIYGDGVSLASLTATNVIVPNELATWGAGVEVDGTMWIRKNGVQIASGAGVLPAIMDRSNRFVGKSNWSNDHPINGEVTHFALVNKITGAFEASATVRFDSLGGKWARVFDFGNGAGSDNIYFGQDGTTTSMTLGVFRGSELKSISTGVGVLKEDETAEWTCSVDKSGMMRIQKDGVEVASGVGHVPRNILRRNVYLGSSNWDSDDEFEGAIANFQIKNL